MKFLGFVFALFAFQYAAAQADQVNVFLGSSGDRGQMSPAAFYPFSFLSIGPQTYPNLHMGYEHRAKTFLGFTHNRLSPTARYIQKAKLNGRAITRNWITHEELMNGGELVITAAETPNEKWGSEQLWVPALEQATNR